MKIKSFLATAASKSIVPSIYRKHQTAVSSQLNMMKSLISTADTTVYGKKHQFQNVTDYRDFTEAIPLCDYEGVKDYIEQISKGEEDVLWPGKPLYFCKSSGTTSGTKYIPVTKPQIEAMIAAARNSLLMYVYETGKSDFFNHKMIFLQGSPELEFHGKIPTGRLSGIVYHHVPFYVNANRMPSYETNCMDDWEQKVEEIAKETVTQNMSLISGIPPWVMMYFEKLLEISRKPSINKLFPDFSLLAHGGVNYEPYRAKMESLIGFKIPTIETYPASEGFIAYSDKTAEKGLLLNLSGGIFYEFIPVNEISRNNPTRVHIENVKTGVNYAIVLNTNAGLWGYLLGDTVRFVSTDPYRIVVTGRIKHFLSAFGEHVIGEEVEASLLHAQDSVKCEVSEFTVAPQVNPESGLPYHEWLIEFRQAPADLQTFAALIDKNLQEHNVYYADLRKGNVLKELQITKLQPQAFVNLMKKLGKLGGQNKVPRLTNDRQLADELSAYKL